MSVTNQQATKKNKRSWDLGIALSGDGGEPPGLFIGEVGRGCVARRE